MASRITQDTRVIIAGPPPQVGGNAIVTQVTRVIIATVYVPPPYVPQGLLLKGLGS